MYIKWVLTALILLMLTVLVGPIIVIIGVAFYLLSKKLLDKYRGTKSTYRNDLIACAISVLSCILLVAGIVFFFNGTEENTEYTATYQEPEDNQEYGQIYFMCGWKNYYKNYSSELETLKRTVEQLYPDIIFTIEQYTWNCGDSSIDQLGSDQQVVEYLKSYNNASKDSYGLAEKISQLPESKRRNTILIGHSLGCNIALKAMANLSRQGIHIKRAILFGAAIDANDYDIDSALSISDESVISLIHPQDGALMIASISRILNQPTFQQALQGKISSAISSAAFSEDLKTLVDADPQLGLGSYIERNNLEEIVISDHVIDNVIDNIDIFSIKDSKANFELFKNRYQQNHNFENFLSNWYKICNDGYYTRLIIPQASPNINEKVRDWRIWWSIEDEFTDKYNNTWTLQKKRTSDRYTRIVKTYNNISYRYANGDIKYMKPAFERIKKQVNER